MPSSNIDNADQDNLELSFLLQKTFNCPCCNNTFKNEVIKTGKTKQKEQDIDLRPHCFDIDPLKYGVIMCPNCGYAALNGMFGKLSPTQIKIVKEKVTPNFICIDNKTGILDYEEAINRHKMALITAVNCNMKTSEKAYLFLLLGWLVREYLLVIKNGLYAQIKNDPVKNTINDGTIVKMENEYMSYMLKACDGLTKAFSEEPIPICGMDSNTITYLIAALKYETGDYQQAMVWISKLITTGGVVDRIKQRGRDLRDLIKNKLEE